MHLPTPVLHVLDAVLTHPVTAQVAPLAVVVGLPALALFLAGPALALARMVFSFWPFGPSAPAPPREERKLRKKGMRRAGQPPQNGQAGGQAIPPGASRQHARSGRSSHTPLCREGRSDGPERVLSWLGQHLGHILLHGLDAAGLLGYLVITRPDPAHVIPAGTRLALLPPCLPGHYTNKS
jgi:hypothetical protein